MKQDFIIKKWNTWPPLSSSIDLISSQKELLSTLPRLLRRRLTPLAKTVFCSAISVLIKDTSTPTVFSSTHGELAKSFKMMEMIEQGEEISPTAFSLSVHNAIAGLFSMAFKNNVESTVVAPGEEGIAAAFIEALGLIQEGEENVLVILYDEPLVDFYPSKPYLLSTAESRAIALLISNQGEGLSLSFGCKKNKEAGLKSEEEQPLQIPKLINFLDKKQLSLIINTPRHSWYWEKR